MTGGVQAVDCATDVFPLRYFDTVGEDLDGQRVAGNFLSKGIQFRWGWIMCGSHLLCGVPWGKAQREKKLGESGTFPSRQ